MNKLKKYIFILAIILAIPAMNYSGFCWENKKWISDGEVIDAAVGYVLNNGGFFSSAYRDIHGNEFKKELTPISYEGDEDFYKQNPGCCTIVDRNSEGAKIDLIDACFGGPNYIVKVKFNIRFLGAGGAEVVKGFEIYPQVNNCGYASIDF